MPFDPRPLGEARRQLALLHGQQDSFSQALYRDLALYLQVLRAGLLPAVQQAGFHVATQVYPDRFARLNGQQRLSLQRTLAELCQRCSPLLTVEQLLALAQHLAQRQGARLRAQQRVRQGRLIDALGLDDQRSPGVARPGGGDSSPSAAEGPGSVTLSLGLPLSADLFLEPRPGLADLTGSVDDVALRPDHGPEPAPELGAEVRFDPCPSEPAGGSRPNTESDPNTSSGANSDVDVEHVGDLDPEALEDPMDHGVDPHDDQSGLARVPQPPSGPPSHQGPSPTASSGPAMPASSGASTSPRSGLADERGAELRLLRSLFALAAEGLGQPGATLSPPGGSTGDRPAQPGSPAIPVAAMAEAAGAPELDGEAMPWDPSLPMPRDPSQQLRWWGYMDRALQRRLRNLSHAINTEFWRAGIAPSLLPLHLLEAVLQGQVESQPAAVNLLRLPLPSLGPSPGPQVVAVLLQAADLEFDQAKLRRCRQRLEQRRRELRKMAQRHRYWQRRVLGLEAEQQWLQDSFQMSTDLPPP